MKLKKTLLVASAALLLGAGLGSCATGNFEIAVVTDVGQLNDGGFNQGTYEGAKAYAEANNKTYQYYQPANGADATDADRVKAMEQAIKNHAKVIVAPGFLQQAAIEKVAKAHTDVKFVFVDGWNFGLSNVTAISYKEEQSAFLAGYAAAHDYKKFGGTFGGGGTNAACNRFALGYIQGVAFGKQAQAAKATETGWEMKISFKNGSSFSASDALKAQIGGWYQGGTEVVFSCGGSMLQSVKAAAAEYTGKKIIGVDTDQYNEDSSRVITSATKGLAVSVKKTLGEFYDNKWDSNLADKTVKLGIESDAVGLPDDESHYKITGLTWAKYKEFYTTFKADQAKTSGKTYDLKDNFKDLAGVAEEPDNYENANWDTIKNGLATLGITFTLDK